mmetsp:Transcript_41942/g.104290  ORF Transcript_41942/g.104290 Transcript_41942/m.104290 type:complete len:521 (+) Transcript_41942:312-1874(+)
MLALVAHEHGRGGTDDHIVVRRRREGRLERQVEVAQQDGPDGGDLQVAEAAAGAHVRAATEGEVEPLNRAVADRVRVESVALLAVDAEARGAEGRRVVPVARVGVGGGGAQANDIALGDSVRAHLEAVLHHLAHQEDEWRVEAERLGDAVAHGVHLEKSTVRERRLVGHLGLLLCTHLREDLRVREEQRAEPRRSDRRGVLPCEKQHDEPPSHLRVGELPSGERLARAAVHLPFVSEVNDLLQEVILYRARAACGNDWREKCDHLQPRGVALAVLRGGRVRPQRGERRESAIERVVDPRDLRGELLAYLAPHKASRRRHDDQFGEDLPQLDCSLLSPSAEVVLRLANHLGHHRLEGLGVHRVDEELHLLQPLVERRVVHNAFAEHRHGEAIHRRLVEQLVLLLDESELRLRANHESDALRADADGEERAVAAAQLVDHPHGTADEGEQVAEEGKAAGDEGRRDWGERGKGRTGRCRRNEIVRRPRMEAAATHARTGVCAVCCWPMQRPCVDATPTFAEDA